MQCFQCFRNETSISSIQDGRISNLAQTIAPTPGIPEGDTVRCGHCVTSWTGQHLHQLVRHPALPHTVNQGLDVPETVNGSKLQQRFPVTLQSDFLEVSVPAKPTQQAGEKGSN